MLCSHCSLPAESNGCNKSPNKWLEIPAYQNRLEGPSVCGTAGELSEAIRTENSTRPEERENKWFANTRANTSTDITAMEYARLQISLKESFHADLPQNVVLVDCLGVDNCLNVEAKRKEKDDLLLLLDFIPRQMLVYVVSLTNSCHGISGDAIHLLERMRQLENKSVVVPTFVFTNFETLKTKWTSKERIWRVWRKQKRRESRKEINSFDDDLRYFFLKFLEALKTGGWDRKPYQRVCLDAHRALESERFGDTDSDSGSSDEELDDAEARLEAIEAAKEEEKRLNARQNSREEVGAFWRELLQSSERAGLQQAEMKLSTTLQALICNTIIPGERNICKRLPLPVVPSRLHSRVRAANASQIKNFEAQVRGCFPQGRLDKDKKYSEDTLVAGEGLEMGLGDIIQVCIINQQKEQKNTKWVDYIETCVQRSLNEFGYQLRKLTANVQRDASKKLRDEIVDIALSAVDSTEPNALLIEEMRCRASAHFDILSPHNFDISSGKGKNVEGWTSPATRGGWRYEQAQPEIYHACINQVMERKEGIISSIVAEQRGSFERYVEDVLRAQLPFNDADSWFDSFALLQEYRRRMGTDFNLESQLAERVASSRSGAGAAAQEPETDISVSVGTLDGQKVKVVVNSSTTISQLKVKLEQQCGKAACTINITTAADEKPLVGSSTIAVAMEQDGVSANDGLFMVIGDGLYTRLPFLRNHKKCETAFAAAESELEERARRERGLEEGLD
jgi:hypothetical protein